MSTDGGENWTMANSGMVAFPYIWALAIDPASTTTLYAGGSGVYKSTNGGKNWYPINHGLSSNFITTLAIDPLNPTILYAGTSGHGVFVIQQENQYYYFYLPLIICN